MKPVIKSLFEQQYLLKVWETIEIRTRMETRVGIRPTIDAFGNVSMETYTYQEEVEYEYKIEGIGIGEIRMLVQLVREGDLPLERAAAKAKMTVEQFKETMENTPLQAV